MAYISSKLNRFYARREAAYGLVPVPLPSDCLPADRVTVRQQKEDSRRVRKTGTRTYGGSSGPGRRRTQFEIASYLHPHTMPEQGGGWPVLLESGLGSEVSVTPEMQVSVGQDGRTVTATGGGQITEGAALVVGNEIRFVKNVLSGSTYEVNVPFAVRGSQTASTCRTVRPGSTPLSFSFFDYWSPEAAVHRVLCGAVVDELRISINGDEHKIECAGECGDVIDSASFEAGEGGLVEFPIEPAAPSADFRVIPGHLGQAWICGDSEVYTLTSAQVRVGNQMEMRSREFGSISPRGAVLGDREVTVDFSIYEEPDEATRRLYTAARRNEPIEIFFQLGRKANQLLGVYLPGVVPAVPEFDDSEMRLQWRFRGCKAQGLQDDEILLGLG